MSERNSTLIRLIAGMLYYEKAEFSMDQNKSKVLLEQFKHKSLISTNGWLLNREMTNILKELNSKKQIDTNEESIEIIIKKIKRNINKYIKELKRWGLIEIKKRKRIDRKKSKVHNSFVKRLIPNNKEVFKELYFFFLENKALDLFLNSQYFFDNVFGFFPSDIIEDLLARGYIGESIAIDFMKSINLHGVDQLMIYPIFFTDLFRYYLQDPKYFSEIKDNLIVNSNLRPEEVLSMFLLVKIYDSTISIDTKNRLINMHNLINTGKLHKMDSVGTEMFDKLNFRRKKEDPTAFERLYKNRGDVDEYLEQNGGKIEEWNS
jgi:hypothetical protein